MSAREPLYEGKAKIIFKGPEDGTLIQYFKDDATAFNAQKKDVITGKGVLTTISASTSCCAWRTPASPRISSNG